MEEFLEEWSWEEAKPLGRPVARSYAHKHGIPHEGVHLWVINIVDGIPMVLFQHRAHWKDMYPDCLDITVGGHVPFGLGEEKIQKEAREEIGITPSDDDLIDLGYFRYEERDEIIFHREFQHVYLYEDRRALDRYVFYDKEVEGIFSVQLDMLKELLQRDFEFCIKGYNGKEILHRNVRRQDFHPLLFSPVMEQYMEILIQAIDQYTRGERVTVFF